MFKIKEEGKSYGSGREEKNILWVPFHKKKKILANLNKISGQSGRKNILGRRHLTKTTTKKNMRKYPADNYVTAKPVQDRALFFSFVCIKDFVRSCNPISLSRKL